MKVGDGMENKIERFLVIVLVLTVVSLVGGVLCNIPISRFFLGEEYPSLNLFRRCIAMIPMVFGSLVHLGVAIWLFGLAREQRARRWMWFVFGAAFGLTAVILFYLIRMHDMLKTRTEAEEKT